PIASRNDLLLHHHRHPKIERKAGKPAFESFGRNSDDGERISVQNDLASDQIRIGVESAFPQAFADHCNRMASRSRILFRKERSSRYGFDFEHVEEIAAYYAAVDPLSAIAVAETQRRQIVSCDAVEYFVEFFEVGVIGI